jgi:hypothetical protein
MVQFRVMFEDMRKAEESHWKKIRERFSHLVRREKEEGDGMDPELLNELKDLKKLLPRFAQQDTRFHVGGMRDPLYDAIRKRLLKDRNEDVKEHAAGLFESQQGSETPGQGYTKPLTSLETAAAAIYGIMQREGMTNPDLNERFEKVLSSAIGEYRSNTDLYAEVLTDLREEGRTELKYSQEQVDEIGNDAFATYLPDQTWIPFRIFRRLQPMPDAGGRIASYRFIEKVSNERWASIVRVLVKDGVGLGHPYLHARIRAAIENLDGADSDAPPSSLVINLPDLEQQTDTEIIAENLHAMQAIYFAATLEELRLFQVRDKLIELFQIGMLPVVKGQAGDRLYEQMKKSITRLSEYERRNLYARTLGMAGGESNGNVNRDFSMLWLRFISAVSSFARKMSLDSLLRATIPARVHQEQVRKAGRDLAANLSLYGYGISYFVATELQSEINEIIDLFSENEIKGSFGARDMWGVVDQVAAMELGGPRDSVRYRTMASAGAVIIRWLANHSNELASVGVSNLLDATEIARPNIRPANSKVTLDPYDSDLVNACERWLAVTGTQESDVEAYSEPAQSPTMTSRPIQLPSVARDMLESVGINANSFGKY